MDRKQTPETPGQHWDREQWAPDNAGPPPDEQNGVWNRHQWSPDNTGTDADKTTRTDLDDVVPETVDDPAVGGLSGHGQPSGESHFERNDPTE